MIFGKQVLLYIYGHRNDVIAHHVTQTEHKNRQTMETKDTCFYEESFIDRSFLVYFVETTPRAFNYNKKLRVKMLLKRPI